MARRPSTIYLARIHVSEGVQSLLGETPSEDIRLPFKERMERLFTSERTSLLIRHPEFEWKFGGVVAQRDLIFGKLGRIRKEAIRTVYDEGKKDFIEQAVERPDADVTNFCLFLHDKIIAFERKQLIGQNVFMKILEELYNRFLGVSLGISLDLLTDTKEIYEILGGADKLLSISFKLKPTNPSTADEIHKMDEGLKKIRADKATLEFQNRSDGLEYKVDGNFVEVGIEMCRRGYGSFSMKYLKGDQEIPFNSKTKVFRETTSLGETQESKISAFRRILAHVKELLGDDDE